jgi:hypothetical protein
MLLNRVRQLNKVGELQPTVLVIVKHNRQGLTKDSLQQHHITLQVVFCA